MFLQDKPVVQYDSITIFLINGTHTVCSQGPLNNKFHKTSTKKIFCSLFYCVQLYLGY